MSGSPSSANKKRVRFFVCQKYVGYAYESDLVLRKGHTFILRNFKAHNTDREFFTAFSEVYSCSNQSESLSYRIVAHVKTIDETERFIIDRKIILKKITLEIRGASLL